MTDGGGTGPLDGRSVRPIDLVPARAGLPDVLAGWDVDGAVPARLERPPFPMDTVVVVGAALAGALLGAAGARRARGRRAALAALAGAVAAGAVRRVWRSP